jgi:hypothetical protein
MIWAVPTPAVGKAETSHRVTFRHPGGTSQMQDAAARLGSLAAAPVPSHYHDDIVMT